MKKTAFAALLLLAAPLVAQSGPGRGPGNGAGTPGTGTPAAPAASPLATYIATLPKEALSSAETGAAALPARGGEARPRRLPGALRRERRPLLREHRRGRAAAHGRREAPPRPLRPRRPGRATAPGEFKNARLAALYTDLVARGKASPRRGPEGRRHDRGPRPRRRRQGARGFRQPRHRRGDAEPREGLAQSPPGLLVPPDGPRRLLHGAVPRRPRRSRRSSPRRASGVRTTRTASSSPAPAPGRVAAGAVRAAAAAPARGRDGRFGNGPG